MRSSTDVHDELDARGVAHDIIQLDAPSHTALQAAAAVGAPVEAVVKSLLFMADGRPVLTLVGGDATVDTEALARELHADVVRLARPREVRELTGYEPGAVPPVALVTVLPVVADPQVFAPDVVYCGGGTTTTLLGIRGADLEALLAPRKASVGRRASP